MITVFSKRYKAVSNLFVTNIEGENLVFPSPISIRAIIEDEQKNLANELEIKVKSYEDSMLILNGNFSLFFYLLTYTFNIECFYVANLTKDSTNQDVDGFRGLYKFVNTDVSMNIGTDEIYDKYIRVRKPLIELEEIT
jgi:hypothetical protein